MLFQKKDSRSLVGLLRHIVAKDTEEGAKAVDGTDDSGRAYEIADALEGGLARELTAGLQQPLKRSVSRLWKFKVVRSEDGLQYRLLSDAGDFLMFASVFKQARRVLFYTYDLEKGEDAKLFDASRPAFVLEFDESKTQWQLVEERCEHCQCAPSWRRCQGKRRLVCVEQSQVEVDNAMVTRMDVQLPGFPSTDSQFMRCSPCDSELPCQKLATKMDEVGRLSSTSRCEIFHSAHNFQLTTAKQPKHAVCQYVKIGPDEFGLDFRYPLSVAQAFGISMTTMFWT